MNSPESKPAAFPATFWTANTIELFERGAYYAMASFVVIYLTENLGMSPTFATFLNGSLLWGLIYFLPIVSGTLADKYGFKRSLVAAFIMLSLGYLVMGNVQRFWPAGSDFTIPIAAGHRAHRPGRLDRQALHRRHGAEDVGPARHPRLRHLLHGHQHRLDQRPRRLLFRAPRGGHPGHLFPGRLRLRHRRPADRPVRLPRAAIRRRRQKRRPGRAEKDAEPGAAGHRHRAAELEVRLLPGGHRHVLDPLRPALQPHAAVPALGRPRGAG